MSMRILRKHTKVPVAIKLAFHVVVVGKDRRGSVTVEDRHEVCATPEQELWRDVIARTALDALGITGVSSSKPEHQQAIDEARNWFSECYDDMLLAFEFADLDLDEVVTAVKEAFNEDRVPPASGYVPAVSRVGVKSRRHSVSNPRSGKSAPRGNDKADR